MKEQLFLSIIVPVYNVEVYIQRCVESILRQSYPNYELILVDDGSTDNSGNLCDAYENADSRIRVYHKENGGLSDARNFGIERANGDCLTFIDSDDYIGEKYLETLVTVMDIYDSDISIVGLQQNGKEETSDSRYYPSNTACVNSSEALQLMLVGDKFGVSACGKLYKRELFIDIRYPKGALYEDLNTTPFLIGKCSKIAYAEFKLYFVEQRSDSITHSTFTEKHWKSWFSSVEQTETYIMTYYAENEEAMNCRYVHDLIAFVIKRVIYNNDYNQQLHAIRERCGEKLKKSLRNKYLSVPYKIIACLYLLSPSLCRLFLLVVFKVKNKHSRCASL